MFSIFNKKHANTKLRSIFLSWLFLVLLAVFSSIMIFVWENQTKYADKHMESILRSVVEQVILGLERMKELSHTPQSEIDEDYLADFYGRNIQIMQMGGILISKNGNIVGDTGFNFLGKDVYSLGIAPNELKEKEGLLRVTLSGEKFIGYHITYKHYKIISLLPNQFIYETRNTSCKTLILASIVLLFTLFFAIDFLLYRFVFKGIKKLNVSLSKITEGNLEEKANANENLELTNLSEGINLMVDALKKAIAVESSRIDKELHYAKFIQTSALAKLDKESGDTRFTVDAFMQAAREVGGDFYDFFHINSNTVALVIADVSDKGIPAALYMMSARDKVRSALQEEPNMEKAFFKLNNLLCLSESGMFMTAFAAIADLNTGDISMINAGHNSPIIYRKGGNFNYLTFKHNFVLGVLENKEYNVFTDKLEAGDVLFMYTDGVTECLSLEDTFFGEDKLLDVLNEANEKSVSILIKSVWDNLNLFAGSKDLSDDVTMLVFEKK